MSKTEKAQALFQALTSQDVNAARELAVTNYIQHSPYIATGLEAFIGLFPLVKESGTSAKVVRVMEDGNFVVLHQAWKGLQAFGADEMVSFDVFRFDDNDKIVEHWDALMPKTPANQSGRTLIDGEKEIKDLDKTQANKTQVVKLFNILINGNQEEVGEAVVENFHPDYKQHNPMAADGLAGFMAAMPTEQWVFTKQHKVIGQGNFVLSISEGIHKGVSSAFYDLVRFENGKIVEHWDVIQAIPTENLANENTMFGF
jgi:predicted SnoaL-like aldol condensation-catalyzing enzyme